MTELTTGRLAVTRLSAPASLDAPDAGPFLDMVRLANAVCLDDTGHDSLSQEPLEVLAFWQEQTDWGHAGFTAVRDGALVGAVTLLYSRAPDATAVDFDLIVDPQRWGEGIEDALLDAAEAEIRALERSVAQTWTLHQPGLPGPTVAPSTGWGSIPAEARQSVLLRERGYSLEQVERNSAFDLRGSYEAVEQMLAESLERAGGDYRLVTWTAPTPEEYIDSFAYVISRMSTDAPQGGLVVAEETWDAERVRRRDARLKAQGLTVSVACVEHVPTGRIAAYNELVIGEDPTAATQQYGTLVVKEHRGHRLGTIVKCANLLRWREIAPQSPRISTFNAEENRHMLDINEAIGFVPISYAGAWKKVLD